MSRFLAPRARRTPISRVRSVTVASMMFMMPMPPTSREMAAIEPSTMLKIRLVVLGLAEQFERHDHLVVLLLVEPVEQGLDLRIGGFHGFEIAHLDRDLVQFDLLGLEAAGGAPDEDFAEAGAGGGERDVDVVVERFALHLAGLGALLGACPFPA